MTKEYITTIQPERDLLETIVEPAVPGYILCKVRGHHRVVNAMVYSIGGYVICWECVICGKRWQKDES